MNLSIPVASYATIDITTDTNVRDVSQLLDLWAHKETPLLNRISWGAESGGLIIEWVSEHLGWRYVVTSAAIATSGTTFLIASGSGSGLSQAEQTKQIRVGTLLYAKGASGTLSGDHAWLLVSTIGTSYTITVAFLSSATASIAASSKLYIVGGFANEGSEPDRDTSRARTLHSNKMNILRQDVDITGSQKATDMHAVGNELAHQKALRLLEMQRDREMSLFFGRGQARSATAAGLMRGIADYMAEDVMLSKSWVDNSTTTLTKTAVCDQVAEMAELGHRPNVAVGSVKQIRKFTGWDENRIRSRPDDRVGGEYISSFLTDTNIELDLVWLPHLPESWLFIFDTNNVVLRAKKGRKLLLEKLGKKGDYEQWQLISEYSAEYRKIDEGAFGAFHILT